MKIKKKLLFVICLLVPVFGLCGCGKQIEVSIFDGYIETKLTVSENATVKEAIDAAELSLGEADQVTPDLNSSVNDAGEPIVIMRQATVTLIDEEDQETIVLIGSKVKDVLKEAEITLDGNDILNYDGEVYLKDGMEIQVVRRQEVSLEENGTKRAMLTTAKTVGEMLELEGIQLGKKDRISPKVSDPIEEGMTVSLQRVSVKKKTVEEVIPYDTETVYSDDMEKGTSKVTRTGKNGKKKVTYEITYVDGKEESRKAIKEIILEEPVNEVITKGNKASDKKTVVSKQKVLDCDGSGHGYYIIEYSDGTIEYEDF